MSHSANVYPSWTTNTRDELVKAMSGYLLAKEGEYDTDAFAVRNYEFYALNVRRSADYLDHRLQVSSCHLMRAGRTSNELLVGAWARKLQLRVMVNWNRKLTFKPSEFRNVAPVV